LIKGAKQSGKRVSVLIQVNISGETTKSNKYGQQLFNLIRKKMDIIVIRIISARKADGDEENEYWRYRK
jgi:uncharacterized DUF497 family protein